jgi:alkylation response protein AidB-like acyl-CoA dehydrogenase
MDLALTDAERQLRDAAAQFVRQEAGLGVLTGLEDGPEPWRREWLATFAAAGWTGLFVPAALGGGGATVMDAAVLYEQLGRGPVPSPLLASSVTAALLLRAASGPARDELLAGIADGSRVVIPALRDPETSWRGAAVATAAPDGGRLSCVKLFVPFAGAATDFLVSLAPGPDGRPRLAAVPAAGPSVAVRPLPGFLHASYEVTADAAAAGPEQLLTLPGGAAADEALAPGLVALAAYQAGGCAAVLDMSVAWSSSREQFGMPIGRFQRVQDHIVRIVNAADAAKWTAYEAAWALDTGQPAAAARAHLAAAVASEAYLEAANAGHEVHAGIGSDPKYGLTLYTRQSRTLHEYLGSPDWHRAAMADGLDWAAA